MYACGTYSGADLYYGLSQVMAVRGGLGVLIGGCLGAICLACDMAGVVRQFEDSCSRIFFCLFAMMPSSHVCASVGLCNPFVVKEGGRARVGCLVSFAFALGGD